MVRSDICHMTIWVASGIRPIQSQKVSWALAAWGYPRSASIFTAWTRSGNLIASWMKKTGMLLPTRSPVAFLGVEFDRETAHVAPACRPIPRHRPPSKIERRRRSFRPPRSAPWRARNPTGCRSARTPHGPHCPARGTIRSGIRSWSKWWIFSRRTKSSSSEGPAPPCFQRVLVVADGHAMIGGQPSIGGRGGLMKLSTISGDRVRRRLADRGSGGLISGDGGLGAGHGRTFMPGWA